MIMQQWQLFPESMIECPTVLAAALCNGNPVIHPAITLLNLGRMEKQREDMFFYKDGVSPMVAKLIEGVDKERMQLLHELGYAKAPYPYYSACRRKLCYFGETKQLLAAVFINVVVNDK